MKEKLRGTRQQLPFALRSTGVVAAAAGATMSRALGDKEQAQLDTDKVPRSLACTCVLCGRGAMQRLHGQGSQGRLIGRRRC